MELVGDRRAFDVLAGLPFAPEVEFVVDDSQMLLGGTEVDQATTAVNAHAKAEAILSLLGGIGVRDPTGGTLSVGSQIFSRHPDGLRSWASSCFGATVSFLGGSSSSDSPLLPPPASERLTASRSELDVRRCLRLFSRAWNDWRALANILEIICLDVGRGRRRRGESQIAAQGWLTKHEMRLFRWTANHPGASGDAARHGFAATAPPAKPMLLAEAQAMIHLLLAHWIYAKAARPVPPG